MIYVYKTAYMLEKGEHQYHKEHQIGRMLLQKGLKKWYGVELSEQELEDKLEKDKCGKPRFKGQDVICFNISHCDGVVVCAFSNQEIGIDVEKIQDVTQSMLKKILTENEQKILSKYENDEEEYNKLFYKFWTFKGSYLKWEGSGFYKDPLQVEVETYNFEKNYEQFAECSDPDAKMIQWLSEDEYIFSVCIGKNEQEQIIYEEYKEG